MNLRDFIPGACRFPSTIVRRLSMVLLVAVLAPIAIAAQQDAPDRPGASGVDTKALLKGILDDQHVEGSDLWIYNDIPRARELGRKTGKPVLVTFRCVPCKACSGFDAEVAGGSERIEKLLRDKFIAVRQVEMKGVDLSVFEFDFDLNWAAVVIHPDGTVYARYGTQSAEGPDAFNSITGLENTLRRALELHASYPANAAELRGKRPPKKPYRTALDMPGLERKEKYEQPTTRSNCIHCHNIHDAQNKLAQDESEGLDFIWRYPLPQNIGLEIDRDDGLRIDRIVPDSAAARSGLEVGERLTHLGGQVLTSIADMQWVLHNLPSGDARVGARGSRTGNHTLALRDGWKRTDISWRGSLWSLSPRLRVWMPELDAGKRRELGLGEDRRALLVRWINRGTPGGRSAHDSGLREGDVVVEVAGEPVRWNAPQFNLHVKLNYEVGDELPITVLRDGERKQLRWKLGE